MKRIGNILTRYKEAETVQDDVIYKQVTIGTNYKGVRLRGTKRGIEIGTKNQWLVKAGQFILSRIDARNSAFGIIPDDLEGALVTNDFMSYEVNEDQVDRDFFNVFLQSPQFLEACIKASRGNTNRKRVQEEFFLHYEVNLPDLTHQRLLIQKIERAKAAMAIAKGEIVEQKSLLTKLKQAILQEAIQGKLTADWRAKNPDTEPVSELLKRIQTEIARLIAEKKIRKEKPLPEITPEEIPFEIPEGWKWCKTGDLAQMSLGKMLDKAKNTGIEMPYLRNLNVRWYQVKTNDLKTLKLGEHELDQYSVKYGDILVCEGGGGIGRTAVWSDYKPMVFQKALHRIRFYGSLFDPFLFNHYMKLCAESSFIEGFFTGAGIPHLTSKSLKTLPIPLPPLAEQAAIVSRVEALMATCRELETEIENSRTHAADLLQAVLKEAFSS